MGFEVLVDKHGADKPVFDKSKTTPNKCREWLMMSREVLRERGKTSLIIYDKSRHSTYYVLSAGMHFLYG